MRIIDADELLKGRTDHEMISTHLIFNAPTVDVLDKIRAEIEQIQGNEYEVSDMQGNRYKYETIEKAEALQIIDKYR